MSDTTRRAAEVIDSCALGPGGIRVIGSDHYPSVNVAQALADAGLLATEEHGRQVAAKALRERVEALAEDYRNHYEMHGSAGDEYVIEDGRCVDVEDLRALLDPTEGETDE